MRFMIIRHFFSASLQFLHTIWIVVGTAFPALLILSFPCMSTLPPITALEALEEAVKFACMVLTLVVG